MDIDHAGIVEVMLDSPGMVGERVNLFVQSELVPEGEGRPVSTRERLSRWWSRL